MLFVRDIFSRWSKSIEQKVTYSKNILFRDNTERKRMKKAPLVLFFGAGTITGEWHLATWFLSDEHCKLVRSEEERIEKYRAKGDLL